VSCMIVRVALLAGIAVLGCAQPKPPDIDGWDRIKWGMTMAEARAAYHVEAQPETKDDWTLLELNPAKIAGVEMGVQVGARKGSGRITSVRLWSYFGVPSAAPSASARDFETLKGYLAQKYGPPAGEEEQRGENFRLIRMVRWKFSSTSILMTLEESSSIPNIGNIDLDYAATGQ